MCSLWKSMEESDDGNLEAVVRGYSRMNPYNWQPAPFGIDPGSTFNATISNSMVFSNLMLASAPASPAAMDLQDLCGPYYSSNISNGGALRSASSCSSLLFESMEVQAAGVASCPIFGADSPTALRKPGDHRETKEESNNSVEMSPRVPESLDVVGSKPLKVEPVKESDGSSSSLSQAAENGASSQPTSKGQGSKRRKTQQKRIVCVPAAGGTNRPSGEGLPSDLWAWRKYGQKPIKGSPYPRGYYRCSSSKGCSARKQVERSRTDPTMLVITYTSDHNHPWPTHRNALAGSTRQTASEKNTQVKKEENSEAIMMPENNNDTTVPAPSNSSPEGAPAEPENMSTIIQEDYNHHPPPAAELGNLFRPDDDFFAELGELPEPLNIFPRHFDDDKSDEDESASSVVDPFNLFNWSSPPTTFVDTKTAM